MRLSKLLTIQQVLVVVLVLIAVGVGVALVYLWPNIAMRPAAWFESFVVVASLATWLYEKSEPFYRQVARLKATLLNLQVAWTAMADYTGPGVRFDAAVSELRGLGNRTQVLRTSEHEMTIEIDGLNVTLSFGLDAPDDALTEDPVPHVNVLVHDYHAPYGDSVALLQEKLYPILGQLEDVFGRPKTEYTLGVVFDRGHPFMGLYLRRVPHRDVVDFRCVFQERASVANARAIGAVTVNSTMLNFSATRLDALQTLTEKHLAMSGG